MDKGVLKKLKRIYDIWEAVEALDDTERFILEVLADRENEKILRIQDALDVSSATAYRYTNDILERFRNFFIENA